MPLEQVPALLQTRSKSGREIEPLQSYSCTMERFITLRRLVNSGIQYALSTLAANALNHSNLLYLTHSSITKMLHSQECNKLHRE